MKLFLYREDLKREHEGLDFNKVEFEHFKEYARNATVHCAVSTFQDSETRQKEIRKPSDFSFEAVKKMAGYKN